MLANSWGGNLLDFPHFYLVSCVSTICSFDLCQYEHSYLHWWSECCVWEFVEQVKIVHWRWWCLFHHWYWCYCRKRWFFCRVAIKWNTHHSRLDSVNAIKWYQCCILAFDPAKNAIPRWCTGRKWHILMSVIAWAEIGTLIDWRTGREWSVNCMTVISAWWRSNMRFQRSSGRWTII